MATRRRAPQKAPSRPPLKAVFFDAGNTLLRVVPSVGHVYAQTARRHGVHLGTGAVEERFQKVWRDRHRLGHPRTDQAEKHWWKKVVHAVLGVHFSPPRFLTFFEDLYHRFAHPNHWRLFPDARPTLRRLTREGFRVGIVSNWDSRLLTLSDKIGLRREVEFLVVSAVEGYVKPDRRLFDIALDRAGVRPGEALHVGDSLREDYRGARAAGLHALLLERGGGGPRGVQTISDLRAVVPHATELRRAGIIKKVRSK